MASSVSTRDPRSPGGGQAPPVRIDPEPLRQLSEDGRAALFRERPPDYELGDTNKPPSRMGAHDRGALSSLPETISTDPSEKNTAKNGGVPVRWRPHSLGELFLRRHVL